MRDSERTRATRGYLFELAMEPDDLRWISATEMADGWPKEVCEYYEDLPAEAQEEILLSYASPERCISFCRTNAQPGGEKDSWAIYVTQDKKERYFAERYQKLKETFEKMTLADFATSDPLSRLAEERWDDAVLIDDEFMTFDTFVRTASTKHVYYVGNVVAMN